MPKKLTKQDLQLEKRRLQAWDLKQEGWQQIKIAKELGVTPGAVSQWIKRGRQEGRAALHSRKGGGAPSRLTEEQIRALPNLLTESPQSYGLSGHVWTRTRIITLVHHLYSVHYSHGHIGRILRKCGVKLRRRRTGTRMRRRRVS